LQIVNDTKIYHFFHSKKYVYMRSSLLTKNKNSKQISCVLLFD